MAADAERFAIPAADRLFPLRAPGWRIFRQGHRANRLPIRQPDADITAPDEALARKIDLLETIIEHASALDTGADKRLEFGIREEAAGAAHHLVGIIAPDHAFACRR